MLSFRVHQVFDFRLCWRRRVSTRSFQCWTAVFFVFLRYWVLEFVRSLSSSSPADSWHRSAAWRPRFCSVVGGPRMSIHVPPPRPLVLSPRRCRAQSRCIVLVRRSLMQWKPSVLVPNVVGMKSQYYIGACTGAFDDCNPPLPHPAALPLVGNAMSSSSARAALSASTPCVHVQNVTGTLRSLSCTRGRTSNFECPPPPHPSPPRPIHHLPENSCSLPIKKRAHLFCRCRYCFLFCGARRRNWTG